MSERCCGWAEAHQGVYAWGGTAVGRWHRQCCHTVSDVGASAGETSVEGLASGNLSGGSGLPLFCWGVGLVASCVRLGPPLSLLGTVRHIEE